MVTLNEGAAISGMSYAALRMLCLSGRIPFIRVGRKYFLNRDGLIHFLETARGEVIA